MKLTSILFILLFTPCSGILGQSLTENFIKTYRATVPISGDLTSINDKNKVSEVINYFDGLGRNIQTVNRQNSVMGYDVVRFSVFDIYGRETKAYLPYRSLSNNGTLKITPIDEQILFYQNLPGVNTSSFTYSVQILENSDLNRVLKSGFPGTSWQPDAANPLSLSDRVLKRRSRVNSANEVIMFAYDEGTGRITSSPTNYFSAGELNANVTYDERSNQVIEYVDKEGRTICKKVQVGGTVDAPEFASTYYVYDDHGNLAVVIPPEGVKELIKN